MGKVAISGPHLGRRFVWIWWRTVEQGEEEEEQVIVPRVCWAPHPLHRLHHLTPFSQTLCRGISFPEGNQSSGMSGSWLEWVFFIFCLQRLGHSRLNKSALHITPEHPGDFYPSVHPKVGWTRSQTGHIQGSQWACPISHLINSGRPDLKIFLPAKWYCLSGWNAEFSELFIVFQNSCSVHQIDFQRELRSETRTSY